MINESNERETINETRSMYLYLNDWLLEVSTKRSKF